MAWSSSNRKSQLPRDWSARQRACLNRAGGRCEATTFDGVWEWPTQAWIGADGRCLRTATDADHRSDPNNHDDLQALCSGPHGHHTQKTNRESAAGRAATRAKLRQPVEQPLRRKT